MTWHLQVVTWYLQIEAGMECEKTVFQDGQLQMEGGGWPGQSGCRKEEENTEMDAFLLTLAHLVLRVDREDVMEECVKISSLLSGRSDLVRSLGGCLRQVLLSDGQITLEEIKKTKVS